MKESKSIQTAFLFGSNSTYLPLEIQLDLSQHEHSQIAGQRILLPVRSDRAAESPQLVTPQHDGRFHHLPGIFRLDRDGEPALDERQGGYQRLGPAREEIEGDDALGRPGVEADVALQQDANAADGRCSSSSSSSSESASPAALVSRTSGLPREQLPPSSAHWVDSASVAVFVSIQPSCFLTMWTSELLEIWVLSGSVSNFLDE